MRIGVVSVVATVDFVFDDGRSESRQYRLKPNAELQKLIGADLEELKPKTKSKSKS